MKRAALGLLLVTGVAHGRPTPSGTYEVERRGPAEIYSLITNKQIPSCPLAESQPIPATLRIEYAAGVTVRVNTENWDDRGPTTLANGEKDPHPYRTAERPDPPPNLVVGVLFRADKGDAHVVMVVLALDKDRQPTCTVAYQFKGIHQP